MPKYISVWYGMHEVHYSQYHTYMRAKSKPIASDFAYFSSSRSTDTKAGETPLLAVLRLYEGRKGVKCGPWSHDVVSHEVYARGAEIKNAV